MSLSPLTGRLQGGADVRLSRIVERLDAMLAGDPDLSFQIAAYHGGDPVLDAVGGPHLAADSVMVPFSVTKNTIGLTVGLLIERKGHHHIIAALRDLPDHTLLIAGEGPDRAALLALAERCGVAGRVRLAGPQPHDRLPSFYSAADALVLAS